MAAARKLKAVPSSPDLATYPYPECREKHDFQAYEGWIDDQRRMAHRIQRCPRCGTFKKSWLSTKEGREGMLLKASSYTYPKDRGYQVPGGLDARDLGVLRMANFMRELKGLKK